MTHKIRSGTGGSELCLWPSGSGATFIGDVWTNFLGKLLYVYLIICPLKQILAWGKVHKFNPLQLLHSTRYFICMIIQRETATRGLSLWNTAFSPNMWSLANVQQWPFPLYLAYCAYLFHSFLPMWPLGKVQRRTSNLYSFWFRWSRRCHHCSAPNYCSRTTCP